MARPIIKRYHFQTSSEEGTKGTAQHRRQLIHILGKTVNGDRFNSQPPRPYVGLQNPPTSAVTGPFGVCLSLRREGESDRGYFVILAVE